MDGMTKETEQDCSEKQARERFEAALRGGMGTSPTPHAEMKLGNSKAKKTVYSRPIVRLAEQRRQVSHGRQR